MRGKLIASLCVIAVIILLSCVLSVSEFSRVNTKSSDEVAADIKNVYVARELSAAMSTYNLGILEVIGDDSRSELPDFDRAGFIARCDSLKSSFSGTQMQPLADSVKYSYSAYMLTSLELGKVLETDFSNARNWYFKRLQPRYKRLLNDMSKLNQAVYDELAYSSQEYDMGFYRSIVPSIVALGVVILLLFLLLFYLLFFYVNPFYRMLDSIKSYRSFNKNYLVEVNGDDQLSELNRNIAEMVQENQQLRKRIADLRKEAGKKSVE